VTPPARILLAEDDLDPRDAAAIRGTAVQKGMKTLFQDGLAKVFLGETTIDEVLRVAL
jgi:type II secretory ATPase GspE/PulE/Tfp pilus assembly ATPase PilB-like protein